MSRFALYFGSLVSFAGISHAAGLSTFHSDYRRTPRYVELTPTALYTGQDPEAVARAYLTDHVTSYGISAEDLSLVSTQESLTGTHFRFAQRLNGIEVDKGELVISVDRATQAVYQVFNNTFPGRPAVRAAGRVAVSADKAFDAAWSDLRVHGKLQDTPKAQLVYRVDAKGVFRLVYLTFLHTEAPFGAWQHEIDAYSGKVLSRVDTAIERKPKHQKVDPARYSGAVSDRRAAFAAFAQIQGKQTRGAGNQQLVNGSALVFDPDPRTTLNKLDLQDDSPEADFAGAYLHRDLQDLRFDGSIYKLEGPWVKVADFESPTTPPSTSTTGHWTAKRGNNAFDDAMVYFHIDQNQRYIQSLGFKDGRGIQSGPIEVDSDGVGGDDNSHYIPNSNRLAFGHGCVDDDEDSDVILHEYGHAITHSINQNFDGGDAGAIGEGFGDYWAASYSISTPGGLTFRPFEIYSWDGHGPSDACWSGRVLNATELTYDPSRIYDAHDDLGTNRQTDELWSTPLFGSLMTLIQQGIPRSEVDQIILEGQFGFSAGMTMRELAQSTVNAAKRLQPNGPHAQVFAEKFSDQKIIDLPQARLELNALNWSDLGSNGVADPGETVHVKVGLHNTGSLSASAIHATLTPTNGSATVVGGSFTFSDANAGAVVTSTSAAKVMIASDAGCGALVDFILTVTYTGGLHPSVTIPVSLRLGKPQWLTVNEAPHAAIPDNDDIGLKSTIHMASGSTVTDQFAVDLSVVHPYVGDLKIVLTSPKGTAVTLHNNSGGKNHDINGRYPTTLTPAQPLGSLVGEAIDGDWTLTLVDSQPSDVGQLQTWGLLDVSGYECR